MRSISLVAVSAAALGFFASAAFAQERWTGFYAGGQIGGVQTSLSGALDDDFCATSTSASGDATASADCSASGDVAFATTLTEASPTEIDRASAASAAIANTGATAENLTTNTNGVSVAAATAAESIGVSPTAAAASSAATPTGSASAAAVALANIFSDLSSDLDAAGLSLGVHAGFGHQTQDDWYFGVETDVSAVLDAPESISESSSLSTIQTVSRSIEVETRLLASLRLRLGHVFDSPFGDEDAVLLYGSAGVAAGRFYASGLSSSFVNVALGAGPTAGGEGAFAAAPVAGGGLEWAIGENVSIGGEALYYFFDDTLDVSNATGNQTGDDMIDVNGAFEARVRLSFRFD